MLVEEDGDRGDAVTTMTGTDALAGFRLLVTASDAARGVVVRCPGVVLAARITRPGTEAMVARLVALCDEIAHAGPPSEASGRRLVRRVAGLLASVEAEEVPDFGLLVSAGERIAAFVHGATDVVASVSADSSVPSGADRSASGRHMRLSGAESATWLDRLLPAGVDRVEIGQTGSLPAGEAAYPDLPFALDLRFGVVAGAGVTLVVGGTFGGAAGASAAVGGADMPAGRPMAASGAPRESIPPERPGDARPDGYPPAEYASREYPPDDYQPGDYPPPREYPSGEYPPPRGEYPSGEYPPPRDYPPSRYPATEDGPPDVGGHGPRSGQAGAGPNGAGAPGRPGQGGPRSNGPRQDGAPPTPWPAERRPGPVPAPPPGPPPPDWRSQPGPDLGADSDGPTELGGDGYLDPVTELGAAMPGEERYPDDGRFNDEDAQTELGGGGEGRVQGLLCPQGHFNNPASPYCPQCNAPLSHQRGQLVWRPRPPLGVLLFDDGSQVPLDTDIVIGRQPDRDDAVRAGRARPLLVEDGESAVSRVHADIHLDGWEARITDHGSANGTYIAGPEAESWTPLEPHQPTLLTPGTQVQLGKRTFSYQPGGGR
jgi:FHA domain